MGTSTISSVGKAFMPVQPAGGNAGSREEELKMAFAEVMGRMSAMVGQGTSHQNRYPDAGVGAPVESVGGADRKYDRQSYREVDVRESGRRQDIDRTKLSEKSDDFAKDTRNVLKEELGVSDEEITDAMERLGIGFVDLLNPQQLAALVAELTGAQDMGALLCNSDFLDVMQAVGELSEELLQELGITAEELQGMLEAAVGQAEGVDPALVASEAGTVAPEETRSAQTDMQAVAPEETAVEEKDGLLFGNREMYAAEENVQTADEATADKKDGTPFSDGRSFRQENTRAGDGEPVAVGQAPGETLIAEGMEETGFSSQLDTSNIIRQIVEFARVTVGNAATTMELQLNPEHLGKVFLELTSKNGVVSAHLTTQNEVAKEALESQLVELRQNLTQAGVKVEAVEVTVGSHEFERNLEQNAKRDEQQAEQQEKAAKQTRRINLGGLDELGGVMSEEESLVAQMMAEQGNSIDYTA